MTAAMFAAGASDAQHAHRPATLGSIHGRILGQTQT
jgi:hypothetical protein